MDSESLNTKDISEVARKLFEMETQASTGKLDQEKFPSEELIPMVLKEMMEKDYSERKRNVILGALEAIFCEIENRPLEAEELANHIRQIAYFML